MSNPHSLLFKSRSFTLGLADSRQRRLEENQRLRANRRDNEIQRTRSAGFDAMWDDFTTVVIDVEMMELTNSSENSNSLIKNEWIDLLHKSDCLHQLEAMKRFYRLIQKHPEVVEEIIKLRLVPRIFAILENSNFCTLQELTMIVLEKVTQVKNLDFLPDNALEIVLKFLESVTENFLLEQVLLILGNITGKVFELRERTLTLKTLPFILNILENTKDYWVLHNGVFTLSSLCFRAKNSQYFDKILLSIPVLAKVVYDTDTDIIFRACSSLRAIAEVSGEAVVNAGVCPRLVEILNSNEIHKVKLSAVKAIASITKWGGGFCKTLIDLNVLSALFSLLKTEDNKMIDGICLVLADIVLGEASEAQCIVNGGFVPFLLNLLNHEKIKVQRKAAFIIQQCISKSKGFSTETELLLSSGVIEGFATKLDTNDDEILHIVLRGLTELLKIVQENEFLRRGIDLQLIESFQRSQNSKVVKSAIKFIEILKGLRM